jgi:hypothetical protein
VPGPATVTIELRGEDLVGIDSVTIPITLIN